MAARLTDIVTAKLLSLPEAFSRLDAPRFASLILPSIEEPSSAHNARIP